MADLLVTGRAPRLRPPVGCLFVAASVGVRRLLLGLDKLDPSFGDELARGLLKAAEPLVVDVPDDLFFADTDGNLGWLCHTNGTLLGHLGNTAGRCASGPFAVAVDVFVEFVHALNAATVVAGTAPFVLESLA